MEILLISKDDFLPYRAISVNIDDIKRLDPHIIEAQNNDLFNALGSVLFYTLIDAIATVNAAIVIDPMYVPTADQLPFIQLFNGVKYNRSVKLDGVATDIPIDYLGLKPYLIYMSYKRFVSRDNIRSTPAGFVTKNTMESTPVSGKQISEEANRAEQDALVFLSKAKDFMKDTPYFKKYHQSDCDRERNRNGVNKLGSPRNKHRISRDFNRNER